ncbi:membrane anchor subunit of succinate dehydrogenase, Sdh4 [Ascosphaera atra]|nr:membrane anchor subunit of succinate dehydrogenase, Sdh4 [Ascosphaera atra]
MASLFRPTAASMGIMRQSCLAAMAPRATAAAANAATLAWRSSSVSPVVMQRSGFQTSSKRMILPALPQKVPGTVNDPAPLCKPEPAHGSYHWTFDRAVIIGLLPLATAPLAGATYSPIMDSVLITVLMLHAHAGFGSIVADYVPYDRLPKSHFVFKWGLRLATLTVAAGLYEFETNDVGLTGLMKKIYNA